MLVVLVAPELGRIVDFTDFRAFRDSTISSGLGNLRHQLSPLEALGIWPASDFRLSASAASAPAPAFYLGALVAAVALAVGLPRWIRRHGVAVPAALAAAIVIYLGALAFGTVYTSAKALAIAAPLITLISLGGLLGRERSVSATDGSATSDETARCTSTLAGCHRRSAALGLALALAAGIALSSFLVLRQAPVAPQDHADQLAELRPLVQGHKVLFLGRDNFIAYELRGSRPFTAVRNYYDPNYVRPNLRLKDVFRKFDFDSVTAGDARPLPVRDHHARRLRERAAPRVRAASQDLGLRALEANGTGGRAAHPGRGGPARRAARLLEPPRAAPRSRGGTATVFAAPPVIGGTWSPSPTVESGSASSQALTLPRGRWRISIQYDSTRRASRSARRGWTRACRLTSTTAARSPSMPPGELDRPPPRPGPVHGQRRATAARGPPAGRLLGGPSGDARRLARRRRSHPVGRSPAWASAASRCGAPAAATWTGSARGARPEASISPRHGYRVRRGDPAVRRAAGGRRGAVRGDAGHGALDLRALGGARDRPGGDRRGLG